MEANKSNPFLQEDSKLVGLGGKGHLYTCIICLNRSYCSFLFKHFTSVQKHIISVLLQVII